MALKARTALRMGLAGVVLGWLAWSQLHHDGTATAASAEPAPQPQSPAAPRIWKLGDVTLTACELALPNSGLSTPAWCAMLQVPENRADPHSRIITLRLAVLRSRAQAASKDMLVFLAGGPGQAATESAGTVAMALKPLLAHRHVLLLDQRGTGCATTQPTAPGNSVTTRTRATTPPPLPSRISKTCARRWVRRSST
jgi:pimeloyl-ACP methyl ester carboxylesterase